MNQTDDQDFTARLIYFFCVCKSKFHLQSTQIHERIKHYFIALILATSSGLPVLFTGFYGRLQLTFTLHAFQCFQHFFFIVETLFLSFLSSYIDSELTLLLRTTRSDGAHSTQEDEKVKEFTEEEENGEREVVAATPTNAETSANADQKPTNADCSNSYNSNLADLQNPINQDGDQDEARGYGNERSSVSDWEKKIEVEEQNRLQFDQNVVEIDVKEQSNEPENDQIHEVWVPDENIDKKVKAAIKTLSEIQDVQFHCRTLSEIQDVEFLKNKILGNTIQENTIQGNTLQENTTQITPPILSQFVPLLNPNYNPT